MKRIFPYLFLLCQVFAEGQPSVVPEGYRVETIPGPEGVVFEVAGLDVAPNGDVFAGTRYGQVWRWSGGDWSLYADGLHEITGLDARDFRGAREPENPFAPLVADRIYVGQKPELTCLVDENADGRADYYEAVSAEFGFNGNYHQYNFGPVRDAEGNFYGTLNLGHGRGEDGVRVRGTGMAYDSFLRGTVYKVSPTGEYETFAWGLRSPAGIGIHPDQQSIFFTDNQGDWNPTSSLAHATPGSFHGHPASLTDHPEFKERNLDEISTAEFKAKMKPPAVWIPQGLIANSPGNPVWDMSGGKFGPFDGQIFIGDQTRSNVFRAVLEKVGGEWQGSVIEFINPLQSGCIRLSFAPDGSLYVGQTARGWGSVGTAKFGMQRIVYEGEKPPLEIHSVALRKKGFHVRFTGKIDAEKAAEIEGYSVEHWGYDYSEKYGSPLIDKTVVKPRRVTVSENKRSVTISLPEVLTDKVYKIGVPEMGRGLSTRTAYYTVNHLK
ncbi:MAG: hypothetical protein AAGJ79_03730 [Verrucomicrobiota bacterium]